mgnify:FL=1
MPSVQSSDLLYGRVEKTYSVRSGVERKAARGTQYDSQVMHAVF